MTSAVSVAVALHLITGAIAETPKSGLETNRWELAVDQLGLLPETESVYGAAGVEHLKKQLGRKLTKEERALLLRDASGKWKTFSDDLVSFELPDDPLLSVKVFTPKQNPKLRIVGGAVGTTDKAFSKVYRITFGEEAPYGLIFVTDKPWFDEGGCFCGPVALKMFEHSNGNLLEMSLLPSGDVKKFQTINDTHRAILIEWTHSAISQSAYLRLGVSLRLKPPSVRSREEWIVFSKKHRGLEAGLGWLRIGTTVADMIELLGEPTGKSNQQLQYIRDERTDDGRGWRTKYILPIAQGQLTRLDLGWSSFDELQAPRGTQAWIEDTLRLWSDTAGDLEEGDLPKLPTRDVQFVLGLFREKAAKSTRAEWDFWCTVVADLARLGVKDDDAAKLVFSRCTEMDEPQFQSRWVLELYDFPGRSEFARQRLKFLMSESKAAAAYRGECHNLFASLEAQEQDTVNLIRQGVTHKAEEIREAAVFFADKLPLEEARRVIRVALSDGDDGVRWSGILNVDDVYSKEDEQWLKKVLLAETNKSNKKTLEKKIARLE